MTNFLDEDIERCAKKIERLLYINNKRRENKLSYDFNELEKIIRELKKILNCEEASSKILASDILFFLTNFLRSKKNAIKSDNFLEIKLHDQLVETQRALSLYVDMKSDIKKVKSENAVENITGM